MNRTGSVLLAHSDYRKFIVEKCKTMKQQGGETNGFMVINMNAGARQECREAGEHARRTAGKEERKLADFWWSKRRVIQKIIWITRQLDHKGAVSGQNEELSKK
ncbi:MAG: hypothetical protein QM270_00920 [Bacillota bacterium]|nr:hypothetical protein [Bacillota bacterium]